MEAARRQGGRGSAAGGEYVGAAILGELLNDLSEGNGEPSRPRALPGGDEGADVGGEEVDGVVRGKSRNLES